MHAPRLILPLMLAPCWASAAADPPTAGRDEGRRAVDRSILAALHNAAGAAEGIEDPEQRCWALQAIGNAYVRIGEHEAARESYRGALRAAERVGTSWIRAYRLDFLGTALALAGDRELARGVFRRAEETAREIDEAMIRQLILVGVAEAMARAGEAVAPDLLDEIATLGLRNDGDVGATDANIGAIGRLAALLADRGDREAAERLTDRLVRAYRDWDGGSPDRSVLRDALLTAGAPEPALRLIDEAGEDDMADLGTLSRIADAAGALDDPERAAAVLDELRRHVPRFEGVLRAGLPLAIVRAEARLGRLDAALEDLRAISIEGGVVLPDWIAAQIAVAEAEAGVGDRAAAQQRLRRLAEAHGAAQLPPRMLGDVASYLRRIAEAQSRLGDPRGAALTVEAIDGGDDAVGDAQARLAALKARLERAEALAALAEAQAEAGDGDEARRTIREAIEAVPTVEDLAAASAAVTEEMRRALADEGREAPPRFEVMPIEEPASERMEILFRIALAAGRVGEAELALRAAGAVDGTKVGLLEVGDLRQAVGALAAAGDPTGAFRLADGIDGLAENVRAGLLGRAASATAGAGAIEEALRRVAQIESPYVRAMALADLVDGAVGEEAPE